MRRQEGMALRGTYDVEYRALPAPTVERQGVSPAPGVSDGPPIGTTPAMTSLLWGNPGLTTDLPFGTSPSSSLCVRLRVWIPSAVVYILIGGSDATGLSFHRMDEIGQGRWSLTLRLRAGTYRYRYYTDGGAVGAAIVVDQRDDALACLDGGEAQFTIGSQSPGSQSPPVRLMETEARVATHWVRTREPPPQPRRIAGVR